jgi:three-Cys-motif partner protein
MGRSKPSRASIPEEFCPLFPGYAAGPHKGTRLYKRINQPIWTEHKARFIQAYLRYFVQITRHGTYIDGFAGPQYEDHPDAWAASLVLESEPKWLRHFYLCEIRHRSIRALENLVADQPAPMSKSGHRLSRKVEVIPGDFNASVENILRAG